MTQPPGFLQGFIPTDVNVAAVVQQQQQQQAETNTRASHLLQPHVRQRARRRSRANRAIQHHSHHHHQQQHHESADPEGGTLGLRSRSLSEVPTARISVVEAGGGGGGFGDTSVAAAGAAAARLDDSKLKGLEENYSSIGENFECNICFQKANEAVVTCCGHLFCWPCLYRWLHIHSYHKECPVCKGAIDENSITPIYGRECSALISARGGLPGGSAADRVPPRPPARRVESARQLREREDRGREREQRERALAREQERDQQDARGLSDLQVLGSGTTLHIEEATPITMMRDGANDQAGQPTAPPGREITSHETSGNSNLEEIDQSEGLPQDNGGSGGGGGGTYSHTTAPSGVNNISSGMHQDPRSGGGNGASNNGPAFLQRRMSERRDQLRAALEASARNGMNSASISSLTERVDERRQMIAAAALLSQDWEDIVNISRMVGPVNPVQAAAWINAVQGRIGGMDGTTTTDSLGGDFTNNSSGGAGGVAIMHRFDPPDHSTT
ncbi:hypothetical protein Mapa_008102 [Marchantia paleacea]|nr:hypothetical protein Mapa_008102 [Marchantia paleacea]